MNTRDEGSAFLRYRKPAVFIRKYMSEELIYLYGFLIKDKPPENVIYNKYLMEIPELQWNPNPSLEDIIAYSIYLALDNESLDQAIATYFDKKRNYKKNWYKPIHEEMTGKISVKNPESLRHYAEGIQVAKRYEKKTIDIKQCMEETAEIIEKWRRDKFSYLTDFFFCPDKPDHSIARAFLYDVTYDSLVILKTRFNGSLEGFNMKVPSDFTTKALSSYRSSDVDTKPSIDVNKNVVLSSRYTYQNEEENSTNVMDMQYTPALPPEFIVDAEMTEEQLIKKLNSFNIGLNVRELDTIDQAVVTQLFTMISGENIGETYISCDFKDFVQRVTRTARPRKANLDDIAERLQKLKYLGYSYTEYDQETGDIKTQASIGFINSVNIDRANNILTFSPSAEWKNQYVTNSYIQIDSESYEKINSYQTRAILMLLQQERLANFAKGITATTLSMKFFRTHMKLIKVQNSMFVRELENHLRTLQSEGIVVEDYEFRRKNTSVKIYFTHLTEMEKIAYGYSVRPGLENNN